MKTDYCFEIVSPRIVRKATPIKSHQHTCQNMTQPRRASRDMRMWKKKKLYGFNTKRRTIGNKGMLRIGESLFQRRVH